MLHSQALRRKRRGASSLGGRDAWPDAQCIIASTCRAGLLFPDQENPLKTLQLILISIILSLTACGSDSPTTEDPPPPGGGGGGGGGTPQDGAWMWGHPHPQGNTVTRMRFVTDTVAYGVCLGGLVIRSDDGGRTWLPLYAVLETQPPAFSQLDGLSFVDEDTGWVVGSGGQVSMTIDGGATWVDRSINTTRNMRDAHFADSNNGFVVGDQGEMWRTSDAGNTWAPIANPDPGSNRLNTIVFASPTLGWIGGNDGVILKTTDGGATWIEGTPFFTTIRYGCPVGDNAVAFTAGGVVGVRRSTGPSSAATLGTYAIGVSFADANTGYATYWDAGEAGVAKTTDGGNTWTKTILDSPRTPGEIGIRGANGAIAGEDGIYYYSTDGGTSWTYGLEGNNDVETSRVTGVAFGDALNGVAVSHGGGGIWRTGDGGESWEFVTSGTTEELYGCWMTDGSTAYATGANSTALKSNDGGRTWAPMTIPGVANRLRGISMWDANNGIIAAGWANTTETILRTNDAGATWVNIGGTPSQLVTYTDVFTAGTDHVWLCGARGRITRSVDRGNTWDYVNLSITQTIEAIMFADTSNGWAAQNSGDVLWTEDGGRNWNRVRTIHNMNDVHFGSALVGIAVGSSGRIARSEDGGRTWEVLNSGISHQFHVLGTWMHDEFDGVVVGVESIMLYTRTGGLHP